MIPAVRRVAAVSLTILAIAAAGITAALASDTSVPPISRATAVAFIRAVTLQPGDLAGFEPFYGEAGSPPGAAEKQRKALQCGHRGPPSGRAVAVDGSLLADDNEEAAGSLVIVMPTETQAKAEIATLRERSGRACIARGLRLGTGYKSPRFCVCRQNHRRSRLELARERSC
jgi:hypothetical protein